MLKGFLFLIVLLGSAAPLRAQVIYPPPISHPRYEPVAILPGEIQDITPEAILYVTYNQLFLFDIKSRETNVIRTNFWGLARKVPNGFFLDTDEHFVHLIGPEEIEFAVDGGIIRPDNGERMLEGGFALLDAEEGLLFRDFVARTNYLFPTNLNFWHFDIAANGTAVLSVRETNSTWTIHKFQEGALTQIAEGTDYPHVQTDGTNVLWTTRSPPGSIYLKTPTEQIVLATNTLLYPVMVTPSSPLDSAASNFAMKNGWVAFPRFNPERPRQGAFDIWRRSPEGTISQVAMAPAFIRAMRDDGGVLLTGPVSADTSSTETFYVSPAGEVKHVGPFGARYFASGSDFYALNFTPAGMALFRINLEGEPFAFQHPYYDRERKLLVYGVVSTASDDYILERTTDFSEWTPIATNTIADAPLLRTFEVATEPGAFRLRRW